MVSRGVVMGMGERELELELEYWVRRQRGEGNGPGKVTWTGPVVFAYLRSAGAL